MPKPSAPSSASASSTCSRSNTGRWSRPSSARRPRSRWRARSRRHRRRLGHRRGHGEGLRRRRAPRSPSSTAIRTPREAVAKQIGKTALAIACDVTDPAAVRAAFDAVARGASAASTSWSPMPARPGRAASARSTTRPCARASSSISSPISRVAQNAVRIMRAQGTGGCLLFNTSKQAINPGKDFGPYGLPKASTLFLMKQYALDHGRDGIRANAVNADRIRSGLLTDEMVAPRSKARGRERDRLHERQSAGPRSHGRRRRRRLRLSRPAPTRPPPPSSPSTAGISRRACGEMSPGHLTRLPRLFGAERWQL